MVCLRTREFSLQLFPKQNIFENPGKSECVRKIYGQVWIKRKRIKNTDQKPSFISKIFPLLL